MPSRLTSQPRPQTRPRLADETSLDDKPLAPYLAYVTTDGQVRSAQPTPLELQAQGLTLTPTGYLDAGIDETGRACQVAWTLTQHWLPAGLSDAQALALIRQRLAQEARDKETTHDSNA